MRGQRIAIIGLIALLPLWGVGLLQQRGADSLEPPEAKQRATKKTARQNKPLSLNPKVPSPLPNLNQGYLFNQARFLKSGNGDPNGQSNQHINMESLQYNGSIIIGETRKALISYTDGAKTSQRIKKTPSRTPRKNTSPKQQTTSKVVTLGESIGGYTVSQVEPLQLTFTRGSHTITKDLFSTEKKRKTKVDKIIRKATPARTTKTARRITKTPVEGRKTGAPVRKK